jgi:hypothetical protein
MGWTLERLCRDMSAQEFGLHLQLEIMRNSQPESPVDPDLAAAFGM